MSTRESLDTIINRMYLVYGIIGSLSGIFLVLFNLITHKPTLFIIVSIFYLATVIVIIFVFSTRWNSVYSPKFLLKIKQSGIIGIYSNEDKPLKKITNELKIKIEGKQIKNIKIIVYYGYKLLDDIQDIIRDAIMANAKVKIIIAGKDSDFISHVRTLETEFDKDYKPSDSENEQKKAFELLENFKIISEKSGKNFKYLTYKTEARYALIAVNDSWAWWTPYHPGLKVEKTTSFILEDSTNNSILTQCINHFKTLWKVLEDAEKSKGNKKEINQVKYLEAKGD